MAWKHIKLKYVKMWKTITKYELDLPAHKGLPKTLSMQWALFHWTLPGTNAWLHQQAPHTCKPEGHSGTW